MSNDFLDRIRKLSPKRLALLALDLQNRLDKHERRETEPIAVIGIGCRFPGRVNGPDSFWQLLSEGVDGISEVPSDRWDIDSYFDPDPQTPGKMVTRWGGFLDQVDQFDARFFGIAPREAVSLDPQQRVLLEVVWEAIENAGQSPDRLMGSRTGVFVGMCSGDYYQRMLQGNPDNFDAYLISGGAPSMAAGRISYILGLQGPSFVLDTACSSSLVAVHVACQSLKSGECDMALAGGVSLILNPEPTIGLSRGGMLSSDGRCKTFDAEANGFVRGEGCGIIILKRLSDAEANGDNILAVVRGSAINQDGRSSGITAPNGPAQEAVIRLALEKSGIDPTQIDYVEAHGTGTKLGDPIEVRALGAVLGQGRSMQNPVKIGSVKTNFGHLEMSAGIAGLIKVVLALQQEEIPANLHLQKLNPFIEWDQMPVIVTTRKTPWPRGERRRIAGVSSFGFSGTNAHLILEESPLRPVVERANSPFHILSLSAKSEPALLELASRYVTDLQLNPSRAIGDVCFTASNGRGHFADRLAVVGQSFEEFQNNLGAFCSGSAAPQIQTGHCSPSNPPGVVFMFTGQGSQYIDMGRNLYATEPVFRAALDSCCTILASYLKQPLFSVLFPANGQRPASELLLDQTSFTQPTLFSLEYSLAELWRSWGVKPAAVMGHSLGEYVAACVAGVFSLEEGLRLVAERSRLMQALPAGGTMAVVFADEERVTQVIAPFTKTVSISAINGPENTVISGASKDIESIVEHFETQGINISRLRVSHAFHSPLMDPMLGEFEEITNTIKYAPPKVDLVSNLTGMTAGGADFLTAEYWSQHARRPVRFAASIQSLCAEGHKIFLEIGPTPVLAGMASRFISDGSVVWLPSLRRGQNDNQQIFKTLASLYVRGVEIDWEGVYRHRSYHRTPLPTYPFERKRYWMEERKRAKPEETYTENEPWREWLYEIKWETSVLGATEICGHEQRQASTQAVAGGRWLLLADAGGTAQKLAEVLRTNGHTCITATKGVSFEQVGKSHFHINPQDPKDFARWIAAAMEGAQASCLGVIDFWALDETHLLTDTISAVDRGQENICGSALYLVQALAVLESKSQPCLYLVTRGAQPVGSQADPLAVAQTTLWGLGKVIMLEHPELRCMCVDLDPQPAETEMQQLFHDILSVTSEEHQVALRRDQWWVPQLAPIDFNGFFRNGHPFVFRSDATYLITGGLRGLGLHLAQWLVEEGARHLVLMGRNGASEDASRVIAKMEQRGTEVIVVRGNVAEPEDLKRAIEEITSDQAPLSGVFHCAGTLDDGILLQQNWGRFRTVMAAKVQGSWNLHVTTQKYPLDCFVLFSSAATLLGSPGQGNYASANAFLDGLAHHRRRQGLPALSVNWGAWNKVGMASRHGVVERLQIQGQGSIEPEQGLTILKHLLGTKASQVGVLPVHWPVLLDNFRDRREMRLLERLSRQLPEVPYAAEPTPQDSAFLRQLIKTPAGKRHIFLTDKVQQEAAQALGLHPTEEIDKDQPLAELGLDSLMAVQLRNALSSLLEQPLPATLLFNYSSIDQLVSYLEDILSSKEIEAGPKLGENNTRTSSVRIESAEKGLDNLSEDEMMNLLATKLEGL